MASRILYLSACQQQLSLLCSNDRREEQSKHLLEALIMRLVVHLPLIKVPVLLKARSLALPSRLSSLPPSFSSSVACLPAAP